MTDELTVALGNWARALRAARAARRAWVDAAGKPGYTTSISDRLGEAAHITSDLRVIAEDELLALVPEGES